MLFFAKNSAKKRRSFHFLKPFWGEKRYFSAVFEGKNRPFLTNLGLKTSILAYFERFETGVSHLSQ